MWAKYNPKDPSGAPSEEEQSKNPASSVTSPFNFGKGSATLREAAAVKKQLMEKQVALHKQRLSLIQSQLKHQKLLLMKLTNDSSSVSAEDKAALKNKIAELGKALSEGKVSTDSFIPPFRVIYFNNPEQSCKEV